MLEVIPTKLKPFPMNNLTIVIASNSKHFNSLNNLLFSIKDEPNISIKLFNVGMTNKEESLLVSKKYSVDRLDLSGYPAHIQTIETFGWKPILINHVANNIKNGLLLYLDAGNFVHESLDTIRHIIKRDGVFCPANSHSIGKIVHPVACSALNITLQMSKRISRDASIIGFDLDNESAVSLLKDFQVKAYDPNCISPHGATKKNHRFDQILLSVLLYRWADSKKMKLEDSKYGISTHNDQRLLEEILGY